MNSSFDYDFYPNAEICSRDLGWDQFIIQTFHIPSRLTTDWFELDQSMAVLSLTGHVIMETKRDLASPIHVASGESIIYTVPSNTAMRYAVLDQRDVVFMRLNSSFLQTICEGTAPNLPFSTTHRDQTAARIVTLILEEARNQGMHGKLYSESLAIGLAHYLLNQATSQDVRDTRHRNALSSKQIDRICDFINCNLKADISLCDLAKQAGLSPFHFSRLFKQSFGLTPHRYLVDTRMTYAKTLLKHTKHSVSQIALLVGCKNHSQFTQLFKKFVGVTPTTFRHEIASVFSKPSTWT